MGESADGKTGDELHTLPPGWSWRPQDDIFTFQGGSQPPKSTFIHEPAIGYVRLIQIRDYRSNANITYVPDSDKLRKCGMDDVMIARYGSGSTGNDSLGRICRGIQGAYNVALAKATPRETVENGFLYYLLQTRYFQIPLKGQSARSVQAGFSRTSIKSILLPLPPLREQRAIAEVLGALDDKIATNDNVLGLLGCLEEAEAAKVVASANSTVNFGSIAEVVSGVSYRSADLVESQTALVTLKSIDRRGAFSQEGFKSYTGDFKSAQELEPGDMVVAKTDLTQKAEVIGRAVRIPRVDSFDTLVASLDLAVVRPVATVPASYILGVLRQESFRQHCLARTSGTTVLHLGRGAIESYEFPLASEDAMQNYSDEASKRAELADSLNASSGALARTRDELLPLLMSGKLRVRDAEKVVEEVT